MIVINQLIMFHPNRLYWWQWGKILGLIIPFVLLVAGVEHLLVWAVAAHLLLDFSLQSPATVNGKKNRNWWVLLYHAFIAGGYPGLILGGLPGLTLAAALHLAVDATDKFGLSEPLGPALDQAAHLAALVIVWQLL